MVSTTKNLKDFKNGYYNYVQGNSEMQEKRILEIGDFKKVGY